LSFPSPYQSLQPSTEGGRKRCGEPDFSLGPTDSEGKTEEFTAPAHRLFAYRVNGSDEIPFPPGEIKTSVEYSIEVPENGGEIEAIAVSRHTYQLIPTIPGISPTPGHGILAGSFEDCDGDNVEGVVARLYPAGSDTSCKNESGSSPQCLDRYFIDETPTWTTDSFRQVSHGNYVASHS